MGTVNKSLAIDYNIQMFLDRDLEDVRSPHDDALVVKVQISNTLVSCVPVKHYSGLKVLFNDAAEKMGILDSINKGIITFHTFNMVPVQFLGIMKLKA